MRVLKTFWTCNTVATKFRRYRAAFPSGICYCYQDVTVKDIFGPQSTIKSLWLFNRRINLKWAYAIQQNMTWHESEVICARHYNLSAVSYVIDEHFTRAGLKRPVARNFNGSKV